LPREILIVDDDRRLAESCMRVLEQAGYACRHAREGQKALQEIRNAPPALVLVDLLLPKQDGRTVLAELQQRPDTAQIPVIVMSGVYKDKRVVRECEEAGARGFLEKPFDAASLLAEIQAILGHAPGPDREGQELRVPLSDVPVSEYLWRTMGSGFSGAVHFQQGKMHKILLLEEGAPRAIRSNALRETLGERLLSAGRISSRHHQESLRRIRQEKRLQGEILVEMGVLSAQAVERCLAEQVEEKLVETFRWTDGEAWLQPGVHALSYASSLEGWLPEDVILSGSLQMPVERATTILSTFAKQRLAVRGKALPERSARITAVVSALRAATDAKTVGALLKDHAAALYGLWLTGTVDFASEASETARPPGPAARVAPARSGPAVETREAKAPGADAAPEVTARALAELLARWQGQTFYETLGVSDSATREDVQHAYLQLARRYHPDRFSRESEEVRATANQLFALLSSARDTLCEPSSRAEYAGKLRAESPPADRSQVQRILRAESLCQAGESLLRKRDVAGALESFAEAVELNPNEGEFHALFAWAHFLVHRAEPDSEAAALGKLERAIALAPESPKGYYYLGQLHKACGRPDLALRQFAKVLQLDPDHVEARREKRLLNMRKDKDHKPASGLFGFGRKKS
jgi:CheY-like chemotaxis protein/tetratricopeptide (TPR) repeat protein